MFTRRSFMQGSAALLGALSAAGAAVAAPAAAPITIDSAETPFFAPGRGICGWRAASLTASGSCAPCLPIRRRCGSSFISMPWPRCCWTPR